MKMKVTASPTTINVTASPTTTQSQSLAVPILAGGLAAGTFDIISAFLTFGWGNAARGVASGLIGKQAFTGGLGIWLLGLALHFFIAISAAAIYCISSRRLGFLREHFIVCGLFYGIAIYLVMNLVVVPLSAFPFPVGPFSVRGLYQGLLVHMILIGLPIAASLRFLSKRDSMIPGNQRAR
jgi:hypothetical protein